MPRPLIGQPAARRPASSELAKALIINTDTQESFRVMYNPEEFRLEQGNNFAEVAIPGLNSPPVQYVRGKARSLSMDLFFDTYETGEDVRTYTAQIVRLLDKLPQTQAPPILLFSMGRLQFLCVLVEAGQRFTMFLRDGTPVRSTLSVRLQEYVRVDVQTERGLFTGIPTVQTLLGSAAAAVAGAASGSTTVHTTVVGDTLSSLAAAFLGDPALWRDIAWANNIDDPLNVAPGQSLVIPPHRASPAGSGGRP